jgi:hypothetical protein
MVLCGSKVLLTSDIVLSLLKLLCLADTDGACGVYQDRLVVSLLLWCAGIFSSLASYVKHFSFLPWSLYMIEYVKQIEKMTI